MVAAECGPCGAWSLVGFDLSRGGGEAPLRVELRGSERLGEPVEVSGPGHGPDRGTRQPPVVDPTPDVARSQTLRPVLRWPPRRDQEPCDAPRLEEYLEERYAGATLDATIKTLGDAFEETREEMLVELIREKEWKPNGREPQ